MRVEEHARLLLATTRNTSAIVPPKTTLLIWVSIARLIRVDLMIPSLDTVLEMILLLSHHIYSVILLTLQTLTVERLVVRSQQVRLKTTAHAILKEAAFIILQIPDLLQALSRYVIPVVLTINSQTARVDLRLLCLPPLLDVMPRILLQPHAPPFFW